MIDKTAIASVVTAPGRCEVRELPIPPISPDAAWLRVEAAGICGSDIGMFAAVGRERILGHENVGVIAEIGDVARERWGVCEGDRVAVEEYLPCGHCRFCRGRDFRLCEDCDPFVKAEPMRFGSTPIAIAPSLWGGFSQYLYLHPRSILHRIDGDAPWRHLAMALPIGNGFEWSYFYGGAGPSKTVVIIGPGQQGIGCALAAKVVGAETVIMFGRPRDAQRLRAAEVLGVDHAIVAENDEAVAFVHQVTNGEMADLVVDTAAGSTATVLPGLQMLHKQGRYVCPTGASEGIRELPIKLIQSKCLSLIGARGHSFEAVEMALDLITSGRYPLEQMATHAFGLEHVEQAISYVAGNGPPEAVHLSICPWE